MLYIFLLFSLCIGHEYRFHDFFLKDTLGFFQSLFGANRECFTPKCSAWARTLDRGKTDLKMLPISLPAAIFHGNSLAARKMQMGPLELLF